MASHLAALCHRLRCRCTRLSQLSHTRAYVHITAASLHSTHLHCLRHCCWTDMMVATVPSGAVMLGTASMQVFFWSCWLRTEPCVCVCRGGSHLTPGQRLDSAQTTKAFNHGIKEATTSTNDTRAGNNGHTTRRLVSNTNTMVERTQPTQGSSTAKSCKARAYGQVAGTPLHQPAIPGGCSACSEFARLMPCVRLSVGLKLPVCPHRQLPVVHECPKSHHHAYHLGPLPHDVCRMSTSPAAPRSCCPAHAAQNTRVSRFLNPVYQQCF